MTRIILLALPVLALAACTQASCPDGQARDNGGQCVAIAPPASVTTAEKKLPELPPGFEWETPQPPPPGFVIDAPAKDQYVTAEAQAAWAADNARRQQEWQAEWDNRRAEARADARTDRIVEAQEDTRRAIEAASSNP